MFRSLLVTSALVLPMAAAAAIDRSIEPVYIEAGQYSVSLQARAQMWRLTPMDGDDLEIRTETVCPHSVLPGKGLWLLGRDAEGRVELVAVSATLLPAGHTGRVALRACDDPGLRDASVAAYGVPAELLAQLESRSGAVLVDD